MKTLLLREKLAALKNWKSLFPASVTEFFRGHEDSVWGLAVHPNNNHLLSCSADGTVKLWDPSQKQEPLLSTLYNSNTDSSTDTGTILKKSESFGENP